MKRIKHNKKRNTLFLFEILVREITQCIVANNRDRKGIVLNILKSYFHDGSTLKEEKDLLDSVAVSNTFSVNNAEKLLFKTKQEYTKLNLEFIFERQTSLIKRINKELGSDIFKNFIPNYKNIATTHQFFNGQLSPKQQVLIEEQLINFLSSKEIIKEQKQIVHIDNLVYTKFVENFNKKYSGKLLEEQTKLLNYYISSFSDNGLELKLFLNEEINRLHTGISGFIETESRQTLIENLKEVLDKLNDFRRSPISETSLKEIIHIQQLLKELNSHGD